MRKLVVTHYDNKILQAVIQAKSQILTCQRAVQSSAISMWARWPTS